MINRKNFTKTSSNKKKSFLAIIPARGNSQRIKNKNLFKLNNKPLIYWTIKSALESKYVSDVCITSDSNRILNYCKKFEVITILRPKSLSGNIIMPDDAVKHAYLKLKKKYDFIVMLQPTSPLRTSEDIDNAAEKFLKGNYDSMFSASLADDLFFWEKSLGSRGFHFLLGIDEAGRGPLAGPVVAAAVILPAEWYRVGLPPDLSGIHDSKKCSPKKRYDLFERMTHHPMIKFGIAKIDAEEIDRINVLKATHKAMNRAALLVRDPVVDHALVDGLPVNGLSIPSLSAKGPSKKSTPIAGGVEP